jgi:hypothetical protein
MPRATTADFSKCLLFFLVFFIIISPLTFLGDYFYMCPHNISPHKMFCRGYSGTPVFNRDLTLVPCIEGHCVLNKKKLIFCFDTVSNNLTMNTCGCSSQLTTAPLYIFFCPNDALVSRQTKTPPLWSIVFSLVVFGVVFCILLSRVIYIFYKTVL